MGQLSEPDYLIPVKKTFLRKIINSFYRRSLSRNTLFCRRRLSVCLYELAREDDICTTSLRLSCTHSCIF